MGGGCTRHSLCLHNSTLWFPIDNFRVCGRKKKPRPRTFRVTVSHPISPPACGGGTNMSSILCETIGKRFERWCRAHHSCSGRPRCPGNRRRKQRSNSAPTLVHSTHFSSWISTTTKDGKWRLPRVLSARHAVGVALNHAR